MPMLFYLYLLFKVDVILCRIDISSLPLVNLQTEDANVVQCSSNGICLANNCGNVEQWMLH